MKQATLSERKSFIVYTSWMEFLQNLDYEQTGRVAMALLQYAATGEKTALEDKAAQMVLLMAMQQLDRDNEKYDEIVKKRSEAGKKGMESRWSKLESHTGSGSASPAKGANSGKVQRNIPVDRMELSPTFAACMERPHKLKRAE